MQCSVSKKDEIQKKYKTKFPLGGKKHLFFVCIRVNNQTSKTVMFCICCIINGFKLFILCSWIYLVYFERLHLRAWKNSSDCDMMLINVLSTGCK